MTRSGSYPLMNLAADYGVDYGDVLQIADVYRHTIRRERTTHARAVSAAHASCRIRRAVGLRGLCSLRVKLAKHATERWR